jgi:beta-lactamase class A
VPAVPVLPPPALERPAPYETSFGAVSGRAAAGTRRIVVSVGGKVLGTLTLRGSRFSLHVRLPTGDVTVRVTALGTRGATASTVVRHVFGLPAAATPRVVRSRVDPVLSARVRALGTGFPGTAGIYVQSLTTGVGASWNAAAEFPAASTLKLAIAAAVLADQRGSPPAPGSGLDGLLRAMITHSDNRAANALEVWLGGSTSAGSARVNRLMRGIGMYHSEMYGGFVIGTLLAGIPARVEDQPWFDYGKHTTAADLATLARAVWLAAGDRGLLRREEPGFSPADARYLLWLLAHVHDLPKLDRFVRSRPDVAVLHKAGWVKTARHDAGLVFWRGGVFVASVMTWAPNGTGVSSDVLAGRCVDGALRRFAAAP